MLYLTCNYNNSMWALCKMENWKKSALSSLFCTNYTVPYVSIGVEK